ncbi:MAG: hypothetical protein PHD43_22655 [Methylococcales bacterium]|nr:hypothetical protein [Methylococcales bacterium]
MDKDIRGTITDERNKDKEEWQRRSIGVPKTESYPQPGDDITVIDTDGNKYYLKFTKSRNRKNVCLGQPSILKNWHINHYPRNVVEADDVYFAFTGRDHEYKIYTSKEWARESRKAQKQP